MPPVHLVCFDLDDTLCVPERSDREFLDAVCARAGVEPPFTPAHLRAVDDDQIAPNEGLAEFFTNLYRAAARLHDLDVDPDDPLLVDLGEQASNVATETGVRLREGAERALATAGDRYATALVTNGRPETQGAKLDDLGVRDAFDRTLFCHPGAGVAPKPDPDPFETLTAEFSVAPASAVVVGDSLHADVGGARRAGLRSVWTPVGRPHENLPEDPDPSPTRRVDSLDELPSVLQEMDDGT